MPSHDLTPREEQERTALAWARYKRLMRWMALATLVAVVLALVFISSTMKHVPIHMLVATVAGVGFSVLLGTALMGLVYFSNNSGHDDAATLSDGSDEPL